MKKTLFIVAFLWATFSLSAEISVFDAGNLDNENPYGLTSDEKVLLKNREKVEKLNQNIGSVRSDVSVAQENIDGIRSVLDGVNQANLRVENKTNDLENRINSLDINLNRDITDLKNEVRQNKVTSDKNYQKISKALSELTVLINKIANTQVVNSPNEDNSKHTNTTNTKKDSNGELTKFKDMKLSDVLKQADLDYKNKDYLKASEAYSFLVKNNYKRAYSNFILGEIEYVNQSYSEALPYYQKSVEISQKGNYMPKLLYHTAISFDKINDTKNANKFYNALKQAYPESNEAKASPNRN